MLTTLEQTARLFQGRPTGHSHGKVSVQADRRDRQEAAEIFQAEAGETGASHQQAIVQVQEAAAATVRIARGEKALAEGNR